MDLLEQYEREYPDEFHKKLLGIAPAGETYFTRLVIRISDGNIKTEEQANTVLLGVVTIMIIASVTVFTLTYSSSPTQASPRELERYGKPPLDTPAQYY